MKITTDDNKHVTTAIESSTQGQTELRGRDTLSAHEMVSYEIRRYKYRENVLNGNLCTHTRLTFQKDGVVCDAVRVCCAAVSCLLVCVPSASMW